MAVLFVNENDFTPARSIGQLVAGALIGILIAFVLHELSTSWVVLGLSLLLTGVLVRSLGLLKGLSTGYLGCWALDIMHQGNQVNWATIFNMGFAAVVGILMAQFATWALWPRQPLQQLSNLEAGIASQLAQQISAMQQWLNTGGPPPVALRSQDLLPRIQLLQQLRDQNQGISMPAHKRRLLRRWAQAGCIWRQLLRQWLLLEPLLRQLPAPLPAQGPDPLLLSSLADLAQRLQAPPTLDQQSTPDQQPSGTNAARLWLEHATTLGTSKPLLLAIGQQCQALQQLARGRALVTTAVKHLSAAAP